MKYISFLCLLLVAGVQCLGQSDSSYTAGNKILKKGFYKTYQEYLDNAPSITADFTTTLFKASKKDPTIIAGTYNLTSTGVSINKPWGFCDGEHVFMRYVVLTSHKYWKLQVAGPHPYILFKEKMIMAIGPPVMAIATAVTTAALPPGFEIMAVTGPGKPKYVWKKTMKKILADQPQLLEQFNKEVGVISDKYRIKYLTLYSQAATGN